MSTDEPLVTDLLSPLAVHEPYTVYRRLREAGPVVWLPEHHAWFLSTYDGVHEAFRDTTHLSSDRLTPLWNRLSDERREMLGLTFELLRGWMVFHDPPDHERLRGPLRRAFTPKMVENLRPRIEALVDELLDRLEELGEADLLAELAFPLPAIVIAELLGVPAEDRDEFKTWSDKLSAVVFGASNRPDQAEVAAEGSARFAEYFAWLIERHRAEPRDDLVSALLAVTSDDAGGEGLTPSELVGALTLLLFGGHETTTNLIANSVRSLLAWPDELAWLRNHPEAIAGAVEELHRYDGSTKLMVRVARDDHERGGQPLRAGQVVFLGVGAANRDPAMFPDPDRLWLARPDSHRHLGFGYGIHFCLGAPLARLEVTIALGRLVQRFPRLTLAVAPSELSYGATILGRGLQRLPVSVR